MMQSESFFKWKEEKKALQIQDRKEGNKEKQRAVRS